MTRLYICIVFIIICASCDSPNTTQARQVDDSHKTSQTGFLLCHEPPALYGERPASVTFTPTAKKDSVSRKVYDKAQRNLFRWASYSSFDMPPQR